MHSLGYMERNASHGPLEIERVEAVPRVYTFPVSKTIPAVIDIEVAT